MSKKEYEDKTISKIDASQLKNSANTVNVVDELDDVPSNFSEHPSAPHGDQRDGQIVKSNPEFAKYEEMSRFNHEIAINGKKIMKDE